MNSIELLIHRRRMGADVLCTQLAVNGYLLSSDCLTLVPLIDDEVTNSLLGMLKFWVKQPSAFQYSCPCWPFGTAEPNIMCYESHKAIKPEKTDWIWSINMDRFIKTLDLFVCYSHSSWIKRTDFRIPSSLQPFWRPYCLLCTNIKLLTVSTAFITTHLYLSKKIFFIWKCRDQCSVLTTVVAY